MNEKLNCIMLVDDDRATNFINETVIKYVGCTNEVVTVLNGRRALDYLIKNVNGKYPKPDLIFLDINMPVMDGWEFLDEYSKLGVNQRGKVLIVMLTTSMNPDDMEKAKEHELISNFLSKPLTVENFQGVLKEYF